MKLSEAMMLRDLLRKRDAGVTLNYHTSKERCGCAIGAGILAVGGVFGYEYHTLFPWLDETFVDVTRKAAVGNYWGAISRRFFDVMRGEITYEQLCDWVKTVEPSCGDCNRFDCTCKPAALPVEEMQFANK